MEKKKEIILLIVAAIGVSFIVAGIIIQITGTVYLSGVKYEQNEVYQGTGRIGQAVCSNELVKQMPSLIENEAFRHFICFILEVDPVKKTVDCICMNDGPRLTLSHFIP
jgi:hypothetical protein